MDGWNISFLLGWPIFRGYISFRDGINGRKSMGKVTTLLLNGRGPPCGSSAGPPSSHGLWRPWMRNLAQDLEGFVQVRIVRVMTDCPAP